MTDQLLVTSDEFARLIGRHHSTVRRWCADEQKRRDLGARKSPDGQFWLIPRTKLGDYEPRPKMTAEMERAMSWARAKNVAREYYERQLEEATHAVLAASQDVVMHDASAEAVEGLRKAIRLYVKALTLQPVVQELEAEARKAMVSGSPEDENGQRGE